MHTYCVNSRPAGLIDHLEGTDARFSNLYSFTVGQEYRIMGMLVWENVEFLVRNGEGRPCFAAAGCFGQIMGRIPSDWEETIKPRVHVSGSYPGVTRKGVTVWGYSELVKDDDHARGLEEADAIAIEIFEKRFAEAQFQDRD